MGNFILCAVYWSRDEEHEEHVQTFCWTLPYNVHSFATIAPLLSDSHHLPCHGLFQFFDKIQIINVI